MKNTVRGSAGCRNAAGIRSCCWCLGGRRLWEDEEGQAGETFNDDVQSTEVKLNIVINRLAQPRR
jgi:hypothetical protein